MPEQECAERRHETDLSRVGCAGFICARGDVVIDKPMDMTGTPYAKGYWINLTYTCGIENGSFVNSMVYNNSTQKWQEYGDREWIFYDLEPNGAYGSTGERSTDNEHRF
ncbi:MAG: hypothetical protein FP815_11650 [Desulfobulbaceae bacterium]|nr:hypothetical protein [Desulfobulbaceae bacterium]